MNKITLSKIFSEKNQNFRKIEDGDFYPVYDGEIIGVAISNTKKIKINEKFNNCFLIDCEITFSKSLKENVLLLYTQNKFLSDPFLLMCLNFIDKSKRRFIENDPFEWINEWTTLIGNIKSTKTVYDILGELFVYYYLLKLGLNPKWKSINTGTYDFETCKKRIEVKTTKLKSTSLITFHSVFQGENIPLCDYHIYFLRVEESEHGFSIADLVKKISVIDTNNIELIKEYLKKLGFVDGKIEYNKKYTILESRDYLVDDRFPTITTNSFKDVKGLQNIVHLEYTVSLDGIEYIDLEILNALFS